MWRIEFWRIGGRENKEGFSSKECKHACTLTCPSRMTRVLAPGGRPPAGMG